MFYHLRGNLIRTVSYAAHQYITPTYEIRGESEEFYAEASFHESHLSISSVEVAESLCGEEAIQPDQALLQKEVADLSRQACQQLDELERQVIERIFLQGEQLIQVAQSLGYSRCHISRVKRRALLLLNEALKSVLDLTGTTAENSSDIDDELLSDSDRFESEEQPSSTKEGHTKVIPIVAAQSRVDKARAAKPRAKHPRRARSAAEASLITRTTHSQGLRAVRSAA